MRIQRKDMAYIMSLIIIFSQYIGIVKFNYYSQYAIALLWIGYDLLNIIVNRGISGVDSNEIKFFGKIFMTPWAVIFLYTIFLYMLGNGMNVPLKTYIVSNLTIEIIIIFAFTSLHIFKERLLKNSIVALGIVFLLTTIKAVIKRGPLVIFEVLWQIISTWNSRNNPFEISDCTFAAGLVFLFYVFYGDKKAKRERKYLSLCALIILLGFKRIQVLAILVVVLIGVVLKVLKTNYLKNIYMNIVSIAVIIVATIYVSILNSDKFINLWTGLDLGRRKLFLFINEYYNMNLNYLGHGYGFSNKFVEINTNYTIIALHNDILRMYVELGCIGFFCWFIYYLFTARKSIEKKYGIDNAQKFFFLTIYLLISYFTDNTINYFATQYFYCIMLPIYIIKDKHAQIQQNPLGRIK